MMIKLHLGCGKRYFGPDWIHIDANKYPYVVHHDIINLCYNKNQIDLIYASHVLEYFDREEVVNVLEKWYGFIKPGGMIRLAVPDFKVMSEMYINQKCKLRDILGPLYGKMEIDNKHVYHKTVYDKSSLSCLLENVGFTNIRSYDWKKTKHSHIDDHSQAYLPHMDKENGILISLNIEAIK